MSFDALPLPRLLTTHSFLTMDQVFDTPNIDMFSSQRQFQFEQFLKQIKTRSRAYEALRNEYCMYVWLLHHPRRDHFFRVFLFLQHYYIAHQPSGVIVFTFGLPLFDRLRAELCERFPSLGWIEWRDVGVFCAYTSLYMNNRVVMKMLIYLELYMPPHDPNLFALASIVATRGYEERHKMLELLLWYDYRNDQVGPCMLLQDQEESNLLVTSIIQGLITSNEVHSDVVVIVSKLAGRLSASSRPMWVTDSILQTFAMLSRDNSTVVMFESLISVWIYDEHRRRSIDAPPAVSVADMLSHNNMQLVLHMGYHYPEMIYNQLSNVQDLLNWLHLLTSLLQTPSLQHNEVIVLLSRNMFCFDLTAQSDRFVRGMMTVMHRCLELFSTRHNDRVRDHRAFDEERTQIPYTLQYEDLLEWLDKVTTRVNLFMLYNDPDCRNVLQQMMQTFYDVLHNYDALHEWLRTMERALRVKCERSIGCCSTVCDIITHMSGSGV